MVFHKKLMVGLLAGVALAGSMLSTAIADTTYDLVQTELDNGLTVIIKPDHRSPVEVTTVWYKVGGAYEHDGLTGISHVLEHLMFQGTKEVPEGEFLKRITDVGGQYNAVTTNDYTKYYEVLAADKLALGLQLEADRMHNLVLTAHKVKKELKVVREERRMRTDDNPMGLTYERFMAASFVNNPYHHPVVGWETDLKHMTLANIKQWYKDWYAPNNAALIIVGDIDPKKTIALVKKYFGAIPSHPTPKVKPRTEVPALGEKSVYVDIPAKTPWMIMGYHTPSLVTLQESSQSWQIYSLLVANAILAGGESSRLSQQLVRGSQLAAGADGSYDFQSLYTGLFGVYSLPTPGNTNAVLRTAILKQIHTMKTDPVTAKELGRVKAQVIAGKVYQQDSVMAQSSEIGSYWVVGLPVELSNEFVDQVSSVKPEQVKAVMNKYITPTNLTTAYLRPHNTAGGQS